MRERLPEIRGGGVARVVQYRQERADALGKGCSLGHFLVRSSLYEYRGASGQNVRGRMPMVCRFKQYKKQGGGEVGTG